MAWVRLAFGNVKTLVSYTPKDPEEKSTSERCIRVPAIVIVMRAGAWNICDAEHYKS